MENDLEYYFNAAGRLSKENDALRQKVRRYENALTTIEGANFTIEEAKRWATDALKESGEVRS